MQHPHRESSAESSWSAETHLRGGIHAGPDESVQVFEDFAPEPTYSGKGKGKAVSKAQSRCSIRSEFLCLPAELRNRIYELVLRRSDGIRIDDAQDMNEPPENYLAITEVCWQTHAETRLLPYSINTFIVDFNFTLWLRTLHDSQREVITSIEISFTLSMRLSYQGGPWSSVPVRQNDNYVRMVLIILPGLRHINLAITIEVERSSPVGVRPDQDDIQRCLAPFRESFRRSTTGVRITSTTNFEDSAQEAPQGG